MGVICSTCKGNSSVNPEEYSSGRRVRKSLGRTVGKSSVMPVGQSSVEAIGDSADGAEGKSTGRDVSIMPIEEPTVEPMGDQPIKPMGNRSIKPIDDLYIAEIKEHIDNRGVADIGAVLREKLEQWKKTGINIGVTGDSGVGKSSFINAIRGCVI